MMEKYRCYAACAFGLESVVVQELKSIGMENVAAKDARVYFDGDIQEIARANLCLSAADRVYLVVREFRAATFAELFDQVTEIEWADILPKSARFPVLADSVRSQLKSVPDIQKLGKKAVVEAMKRRHGLAFYRENGAAYSIYINILADKATVCLNTSGMGLNRRGYRVHNGPAPLRETLAAGLIYLTRWSDRPFYDIMCGSGTIAIEAALKARGIAPGVNRKFDMDGWGQEWQAAMEREREQAKALALAQPRAKIFASDIDPQAVKMAQFHARRAGVLGDIAFSVADAREFSPKTERSTLVMNPPYAVRLGEEAEVAALYRDMGQVLSRQNTVSYYVLSGDDKFERKFGKEADKRRKVYNGNIKCCFYQYFR